MRGHWIGGTRKLNKHWQSGEGGHAEFSRWFTTIKRGDDYYCFAPSYAFVQLPSVPVGNNLKNVWTTLGNIQLTPSVNNNMNFAISYNLEDMRENGTIFTRTLSPSDRVKVIIPTFKVSINLKEVTVPLPFTEGYTYEATPSIPTGAEILWQNDSDLLSYESRYDDDLNLVRNTWNAWDRAFWNQASTALNLYPSYDFFTDEIGAELLTGYYDHDTSTSGVPIAENLLSPVMQQKYTGNISNLILPFNSYELIGNYWYDYSESKNYAIWYKLELVSLDLQERTIV